MTRHAAKDRLLRYAAGYDTGDERIRLKITHMLNVAAIAEGLARSLRLGERMAENRGYFRASTSAAVFKHRPPS